MDHVGGPLHALLAEKVERILLNIMCLKLYPFKRITWWCLYVMEYVLEYAMQYVMKFVLVEKIL